jgi:NAD(P)-dependent dehydrogenase (short-subunit alcohol dehydrogenase family)
MKVQGKTLIVTGGGSGIGRALCLNLAAKGAKVIVADVNEAGMQETKKLAATASENVFCYPLNLADEQAIISFSKHVLNEHQNIDGIINNAGIIQPFVPVNDLSSDVSERIMRVNFWGTFHLIKQLLPYLLKRPEAHIVNVASMAAFIPFPGQTIYGASKAAVKLLTEGLFAELQETKVGITLVMPGAVNTNIMVNSGVEVRISQNNNKQAMQALPADKAAEMIVTAIERNTPRLLVGNDARFLDLFNRFFPTRSIRFIVKKMKVM